MVLQTALEELLEKTLTKYDDLEGLKRQSQKLRVSYSAQVDDNELLEQEYRKLYVTHVKLKERLTSLEAQVAQGGPSQSRQGGNRSVVGDIGSMEELQLGVSTEGPHRLLSPLDSSAQPAQQLDDDDPQQFHVALKKTHALFEVEASNLQSVRDAHFAALRQRTELELYLRQAIVHHKMSRATNLLGDSADVMPTIADVQTAVGQAAKERMMKASKNLDSRTVSTLEGPPVQFDVEDRKTIIDRLLSKHRVLGCCTTRNFLVICDGVRCSSSCIRQLRKSSSIVDRRASTPSGRTLPQQFADRVVHPVKEQAAGLADLLHRWQQWAGRANSELSNSSSM